MIIIVRELFCLNLFHKIDHMYTQYVDLFEPDLASCLVAVIYCMHAVLLCHSCGLFDVALYVCRLICFDHCGSLCHLCAIACKPYCCAL